MADTNTRDEQGLGARLAADHDRLDRLFVALLSALRADARDEVIRLWAAFDEGLTRHMDAEEVHVLPALLRFWPEEVDELLREHGSIRAQLADLGVGVDLHELSAAVVEEFVEQLRRHAHREEALAYRWAEQHLPEAEQGHLRRRLDTESMLRRRLAAVSGKRGPSSPG